MTLGPIDKEGKFDSFQGSKKQKENSLKEGIYATFIKSRSGSSFLGTRADSLGMRPGDNISFFALRREVCFLCRYL